MNESLVRDSLQVAEKAITNSSKIVVATTDIWMWIAILEFIIICFLFLTSTLKKKQSSKQRFKDETLGQDIDFNNIINSSFHSTKLYDELKIKCHPDKFYADPKLNSMATKLFQEITKNKTNIRRLQELKLEAQQKLNIKF